jgi:hypothetical protein
MPAEVLRASEAARRLGLPTKDLVRLIYEDPLRRGQRDRPCSRGRHRRVPLGRVLLKSENGRSLRHAKNESQEHTAPLSATEPSTVGWASSPCTPEKVAPFQNTGRT